MHSGQLKKCLKQPVKMLKRNRAVLGRDCGEPPESVHKQRRCEGLILESNGGLLLPVAPEHTHLVI